MKTLDATYTKFADELDQILKELEQLHKLRKNCKYNHSDVRCAFLDRMFGILDNYYKSLSLMVYLSHKDPEHKTFPYERLRLHLLNLEKIGLDQDGFDSYYHLVQRTVLIDSWSCFEDSLSIVADAVLPVTVLDEYKNERFEAAMKILNGISIPEKTIEKLKSLLEEKHLPVVKKSNKLFKEYKSKYQGKLKDDQELLDFYRVYRNTLHSNFIYHGKNFDFNFNGKTIKFVDKDSVYDNIHHYDRFLLAKELITVFNQLMDAIDHKQVILDTDVNKL